MIPLWYQQENNRERGWEDNKEKSLVSGICGRYSGSGNLPSVYGLRHSFPRQKTHEIMGALEFTPDQKL
jgi:hypothetical protein